LAQDEPAVARATPTNAVVYRFTIGDFKAMVVSDGTLTFPVGFFVPNADPEAAAAALVDNFLSPENVLAHVNALYVETAEHKVLIDTGAGNTFGPSVGYLASNLEAAGVPVDTIDTIIITHAHPDHIGGILDDSGNPVFANASYYISETEWDFWTAPTVEMPNTLIDADTQATLVGVAKQWLGAIASRTSRFALGDEIIPGIVSVPSVGHTPGQASYLITSGEDSLLATGDVFFSDPLNLEHPDWEVVFDTDPKQGVATRKQLLATVTVDRRLLLVPHMPFPGLGHVRAQRDVYGWEPIVWDFMFES
jgi:glyoxylase-like metal-dependent hydrolase (beta-lactamase superfamily II)